MLDSWSPSSKTYPPSKSGQTSNLPSSLQKLAKHRKNGYLSVETVIKQSKAIKYPLKASTDNNSFDDRHIISGCSLFLKKFDQSSLFLPTSQSPEPIGSKPGSVTSTSTYLLHLLFISSLEFHLPPKVVKVPSNPIWTSNSRLLFWLEPKNDKCHSIMNKMAFCGHFNRINQTLTVEGLICQHMVT